MRWLKAVVISFTALWIACAAVDMKFPPGFKFGAGTSAYQIEGAWNASDKGINIWDSALHNNAKLVTDRTTGDVACNSYHLWKEDIHIAHELGLHFYRFSISWTRILPTGFPNKISKDGIKYYNKLIDGLLRKGIEPVITIYHFDLPLSIQNLDTDVNNKMELPTEIYVEVIVGIQDVTGGWTNPLIADWFADFARVAFSNYADRVKTWITINEPHMVCDLAYNFADLVPDASEPWLGPFLCNKNVLMAHAKAWRIYDENYKQKYNGKVSLANNPIWLQAKTEDDEDLAELAREFGVGRFSDPIYSEEGGWPPAIEKLMIDFSKKQGFPYSRLPLFTEEEKKFIKGTYDYYSLIYYTSRLVRPAHEGEEPGPWFLEGSKELNVILETDPRWPVSDSPFVVINPEGLRRQITWITRRYNNVSILLTENGLGTKSAELHDTARIRFIQNHLQQILLAIYEDGANVIGYTVWSLMDNFEWIFGQTLKFGLYNVDFTDPLRTRTPRASAHYFKSIIKHHSLDVPHPSKVTRELRHSNAESIKFSICTLIGLITLGKLVSNCL